MEAYWILLNISMGKLFIFDTSNMPQHLPSPSLTQSKTWRHGGMEMSILSTAHSILSNETNNYWLLSVSFRWRYSCNPYIIFIPFSILWVWHYRHFWEALWSNGKNKWLMSMLNLSTRKEHQYLRVEKWATNRLNCNLTYSIWEKWSMTTWRMKS